MKKEEHLLQVAIHKYLNLMGIFHFSVPNGGLRNLRVAVALKAEGALSGVADLIILLQNECIFVELKNGKAGRQSDSQKEFQNKVESLGFKYLLWRSIDDCVDFVQKTKNL
jgi:hypothetical protein